MTITLDLADDVQQAIERKAHRQGITASEYLRRVVERAARPTHVPNKMKQAIPKSGAEILAEIEALNLPAGYGDPNIDSPELARQLAVEFSNPIRDYQP